MAHTERAVVAAVSCGYSKTRYKKLFTHVVGSHAEPVWPSVRR